MNSPQKETNMKEFEVELSRMTHYSQYGTFVIKAESELDAEKKINKLIAEDGIPNDNYFNETNKETGEWLYEPEYPGDEEETDEWEIQVIMENKSALSNEKEK